jgi:hypothetical protein
MWISDCSGIGIPIRLKVHKMNPPTDAGLGILATSLPIERPSDRHNLAHVKGMSPLGTVAGDDHAVTYFVRM